MNFNQRECKRLGCAIITAGETAQSTEVYSEGWPDRNVFLIIPLLEQTPHPGGGLGEGTPL